MRFVVFSVLLLAAGSLLGQPGGDEKQGDDLVQFSGVLMSSDSLRAVPYGHIINIRNGAGAVANLQGFFSFVAAPGDSILFTSVGYKEAVFVIPPDLRSNKYSVIKLLTEDTVFLDETIIYPWPTPDEFREAFLALDVPDTYLDRARENLEREKLKEMGKELPRDGNEMTDYYFRSEARKYYYAGQNPPIRLFDVFAWKEFIDAWKRGDFKKQ